MMEVKKLARNIFSTGKLIQDRVFRVQTTQLEKIGKRDKFGDLTVAQLHAILMIHMRNQVSINELSNLLSVSPPSASVMVDRLVEKGILLRKPCKQDRRKVEIRISENAIDTIESVEEAILQSFVQIVEEIGSKTAKQWCDVLEKVKPVLQKDADTF
jgi:DNA-binding MarR family transcriptional regulator